MLDVLESMSGHYHEHHDEILRWSWKLFCVKWVRLLKAAKEERDRREEREIEAEQARLRNA